MVVWMTIVNLRLTGDLERLVDSYLAHGYAASKAEVLRMGLLALKRENPDEFEDISDDPELEQELRAMNAGKLKPKMLGPVSNVRDILKNSK